MDKNPPIRYRIFENSDVDNILRLASKRFKERYSSELILQIHNLFPEGFLVAEFKGGTVGYITAIPHYSSSLRVLMLAVEKEWEGRGIGKNLLARIENIAYMKGFSSIKLEVRMDNIRAIGFYRHMGYKTTGIIEHYYSDGSHAFVMEKKLSY